MERLKVLFLSIPRVVYDRNLHDRCTDFGETAGYIINKYRDEGVTVDIFDGSIPCASNRSIYRLFTKNYDLIVFYVDVPEVDAIKKYCQVLEYISPNTKTFIYGDSTLTIPGYFKREPFNAIHISGDQEGALSTYIDYLLSGNKACLKGISLFEQGVSRDFHGDIRIEPELWAYPPIDLLPIDEYKKFAKEYKLSRYACSVYVSKGCPKRCKYCLCVPREGAVDRRRPVKELVDFLEKYCNDFDLFKMHSADFLLDRQWVKDFCAELKARNLNIKWKITSCFSSMDEEIVSLIVDAGCISIGFGVETFYKNKEKGFKLSLNNFEKKMSKLSKINVSYKGFIMIGVEEQTIEDIQYTIDILNKHNIKIRPATYTPFHLLSTYSIEELDSLDLESWNKKECIQAVNNSITEEQVYRILFGCKL